MYDFAVDLNETGTTQRHALGALYEEPTGFIDVSAPSASRNAVSQGRRIWIYVEFAAGQTITAGNHITRPSAVGTYTACTIAATSAIAGLVPGVAQRTHGDASSKTYGWILREGVGLGQCDATGVTLDQLLISDDSTAGCQKSQATDTAAGIGIAIATRADAGTFAARFWCRG